MVAQACLKIKMARDMTQWLTTSGFDICYQSTDNDNKGNTNTNNSQNKS